MPINRENYFRAARGIGWGDRLIEQFDEYNKKMNSYLSVSSELSNTLLEVREAFHDNHLITAEECAKQMQERTEIYLNE